MRENSLRYRRVGSGIIGTLLRASAVLCVVTLLSAGTLHASPTIAGFTPATGGPGTVIMIYGSEFGINVVGLIP